MDCPRCHNTMEFDWSIGTMRCARCDYELFQEEARQIRQQLDGSPPQPDFRAAPAPQPPPTAATTNQPPIPFEVPGGMDMDALPESLSDFDRVRMHGRLEAAMFALSRRDNDGARLALQSALEISEDYVDGWLQLAALARDADEQRTCLEHALAAAPTNPIAMKTLAQLDGKFEAEAAPTADQRLEPGQVAAQQVACPQCGGRLTYDETRREVFCAFCGYRVLAVDDLSRSGKQSPIMEGILKRKVQGRPWSIGQRWLRCSECGAVTTLSRQTLTNTCRFCQSRHVIQESVNSRFEQPDLIVPFAVDQQNAQAAIMEKLRSGIRAITRFFADAIARIDLQGAYLPFWVFDADMIVNWSWSNAPDRGQHPVLLSDVPYLAASTPSRKLMDQIEPYDLQRGVDYDPRLLAAYPAQLYTVDMTDASIQVRTKLCETAQRRAEVGLRVRRPSRGYGHDDDPGSLQTNAYTQFMTYRLTLLPVWVAQLVEEDDDRRQVLVNGQTAKVALGRTEKAE